MQLNQIRYMAEVNRCGSFSAAAKELFITQPTLSQQVMALEEELGVKLFVRHPRGVSLTDAGQEFATYAQRILNEVDSLQDSMHSFATRTRGRIKIGVLWVFAYLGIAEVLSGFRAANPGIETIMTVGGSVRLREMLINRDVDAIFFISMGEKPGGELLYTQKWMESDMMAVLPADNPLAKKESLTYSDLAGENIILPARDSTIYNPVVGNFQAGGITPRVVGESAQSDVSMACVDSGMGIAFMSGSIAHALATPRVAVRPLLPNLRRTVYFATLRDTLTLPTVAMLADYVKANHVDGENPKANA